MSYLDEDTINWYSVAAIDEYLDSGASDKYRNQPLAQDWARVSKVIEELGEAISEMILYTGQNPRKGTVPEAREYMLNELGDVAFTAILAIQHFTKDADKTRDIIRGKGEAIAKRALG